ncbi:inactive receptor-like serine/threonine-protein kinase At2g40270 isoform X2 [Cynara cardunculus var. scolymus]|uniref:inactive receptor-like serine/threonine-protein kinase At2g40270 isoform X2 n=1 Tax=Cynara cardunculus var. scolymus TaxID=59895 RepID=UPI000D623C1E|nr:inactive receptor-like serine/threonine-protein kinase At2g40270 isoform X2 [Cynara cardunculus var. scolymus]
MEFFCNYNRFKLQLAMLFTATLVIHHNFSLCWSLNAEGLALLKFRDGIETDPFGVLSGWNNDGEAADLGPCSWFGVECSDGKVVILDLCLGGTLSPEVGKLTNIKSIILRNNSFYGTIPQEIGDLEELEVLDLGYNNFSGSFPSDLGNNLSLSILLLDNNSLLDDLSPDVNNLKTISEFQVDEDQLTSSHNDASCNSKSSSWKAIQAGDPTERKLLQVSPLPSSSGFPISYISLPPSAISYISASPSPSEVASPSPSPVLPPLPVFPNPPITSLEPETKPALAPSPTNFRGYKSKHHRVLIWSGVVGGSIFVFLSAFGCVFFKRSKVVTVKPWATGLSGQLQKAFTTGVPSLQRPELVTACEDFSNIIGSMLDGTVYKGTLSSGVEIAVTSTAITSAKDWTKNLETQFRNKIEMLSKVNHKNFVNLIGFCEEQNPFTRMMVFEYAPNGTLFEHLHIEEAEHLDWSMRIRIAMGMAYCLEYLHQLNPPIAHKNLQSSSIHLTEDYAAKISDFSFWDAAKTGPTKAELLETPPSTPQSNVYSFGVILLELITGKIPYSVNNGSLVDWASDFLNSEQPITNIVDPTLTSFKEDAVKELFEVVKSCVLSDPNQRPTMREVTARLKMVTAMAPEGAIPRTSPLWWAELEILSSTESN